MQVHIMGSAAAEGWPGIWCRCEPCQRARNSGGKNLRSRSGALIDGKIKLDLCPDTYMQSIRDGLDLSGVTDLLVTHAHPDHLEPTELRYLSAPFAHENYPMHVWGSQQVIDALPEDVIKKLGAGQRLHVLTANQTVELNDGTKVTPLAAAHAPDMGPFNYIVERGGKTLLYGLDSGWYPEQSWEQHQGHVFDLVVLDCTLGQLPGDGWGHGNLDMAVAAKERMLKGGTANAGTVFLVNHFSHNGGLLHSELEERMLPHNILVGYDGMDISV